MNAEEIRKALAEHLPKEVSAVFEAAGLQPLAGLWLLAVTCLLFAILGCLVVMLVRPLFKPRCDEAIGGVWSTVLQRFPVKAAAADKVTVTFSSDEDWVHLSANVAESTRIRKGAITTCKVSRLPVTGWVLWPSIIVAASFVRWALPDWDFNSTVILAAIIAGLGAGAISAFSRSVEVLIHTPGRVVSVILRRERAAPLIAWCGGLATGRDQAAAAAAPSLPAG